MLPRPLNGMLAGTASLSSRLRLGPHLGARLVSALALGLVALAADFSGMVPLAVLIALLATAMCWEWGHMVRGEAAGPILLAHVLAVLSAISLAVLGFTVQGFALLAAGAGVVLFLTRHLPRTVARLSALGVLYAGAPAVVLLWLRESEPAGALAILFLLLAVGVYDSAAFLTGRLLDGPKLWVQISPQKTWAGVIGGLAASTVAGALFSVLLLGTAPLRLSLIAAFLGLMAQAGDLLESALKRHCGVKDASELLPGHGGVMDRADSMVIAALAAGLLALALNPAAPARALLYGY